MNGRRILRVLLALVLGLLAWRSAAQSKYQLKTGQTINVTGLASVQLEGVSFRTSGVGVVSKRYQWTEFAPESLRKLKLDIQKERRFTVSPVYSGVVQAIIRALQDAGGQPVLPNSNTTNAPKSTNNVGGPSVGMSGTVKNDKSSQLAVHRPVGLPKNFKRTFEENSDGNLSYATLAAVVLLFLGTVGFGVFQTVRFYNKIEDRQAAPHVQHQATMEAAQSAVADSEATPSTSAPPPLSTAPPPSSEGGHRVFTRTNTTFNRRFMEIKMMNFLKLNPEGGEYLVVKSNGQEYCGRRIAGLSKESMTLEVGEQNVWEQREISYDDIDQIEIRSSG